MSDLSDQYLREHYAYNQISVQRQAEQRRVIGVVEAHVKKPLEEMRAVDFRGYLQTRLSEGLAPTTVDRHRRMVTPFIKWLWDHSLLGAEEYIRYKDVKAPRGAYDAEPRPYSPAERERMWEAIEERWPWQTTGSPRTRERAEMFVTRWLNGQSQWKRVRPMARRLQVEAVIAVCLYGGLRCHEAFGLELEEMHHENEYLVVSGARKNRQGATRRRLIPWMSREMRVAVKDWLWFRDITVAEFGVDHSRPWLALDHSEAAFRPMTFKVFSKMFDGMGEVGFHRLRHTAATEMLRAGMKLQSVQKVLGHSSIEMTLRYAKIADSDILDAAIEVSPAFSRALRRRRPDTETLVST